MLSQVDAFVEGAAAQVQEMRGAVDAHKQTAAAEAERISAAQLEVQSQLQQSEAMAAAKAGTRTKNQDKLAELAEQVRVPCAVLGLSCRPTVSCAGGGVRVGVGVGV